MKKLVEDFTFIEKNEKPELVLENLDILKENFLYLRERMNLIIKEFKEKGY